MIGKPLILNRKSVDKAKLADPLFAVTEVAAKSLAKVCWSELRIKILGAKMPFTRRERRSAISEDGH